MMCHFKYLSFIITIIHCELHENLHYLQKTFVITYKYVHNIDEVQKGSCYEYGK